MARTEHETGRKAEREGFEPSVRVTVHDISSVAQSAALSPLPTFEKRHGNTSRFANDPRSIEWREAFRSAELVLRSQRKILLYRLGPSVSSATISRMGRLCARDFSRETRASRKVQPMTNVNTPKLSPSWRAGGVSPLVPKSITERNFELNLGVCIPRFSPTSSLRTSRRRHPSPATDPSAPSNLNFWAEQPRES